MVKKLEGWFNPGPSSRFVENLTPEETAWRQLISNIVFTLFYKFNQLATVDLVESLIPTAIETKRENEDWSQDWATPTREQIIRVLDDCTVPDKWKCEPPLGKHNDHYGPHEVHLYNKPAKEKLNSLIEKVTSEE